IADYFSGITTSVCVTLEFKPSLILSSGQQVIIKISVLPIKIVVTVYRDFTKTKVGEKQDISFVII
ncbi:hypothetical protein L9F63_022004, partial [Diploptera punctata]